MTSAITSAFYSVMSVVRSIISFIMAILMSMGHYTTPGTDDPIKAINSESVKLTFTAVADSQVNGFTDNQIYLENVFKDLSNAEKKQDALVIAGDITENSLITEWDTVYSFLKTYDPAENYIMATGNHDIRIRTHSQVVDRFTSYYNKFTGNNIDELYYSYEVNGYTFVVIGSEHESLEKQVISDKQLSWIDETLSEATAEGKPVFVICHQPLRDTHGLPALWNNGVGDSGHIGNQSEALEAIFNKYENVILLSGHLHTGFGQYTYQTVGNIHSINLPAVGKENKDGEYLEYAIGYTAEVYENAIIFRARDFGHGVYVPEYDITIPIV